MCAMPSASSGDPMIVCCCAAEDGGTVVTIDANAVHSRKTGIDYEEEEADSPQRSPTPEPPSLDVAAEMIPHSFTELVSEPTGAPEVSVTFTLGAPDGKVKTAEFRVRPLGLDFEKFPPFTVMKAHGHAADLGIQPGWFVQRVGSVDMRSEADIDGMCEVLTVLRVKVRIVVEQARGGDQKMAFIESRPLGLDFAKTPPFPIKAVAVDGHAEKFGLQQGWLLRQIGHVEIKTEADLSMALRVLECLPRA